MRNNKTTPTFWLVFLFMAFWTYTEVSEYVKREYFTDRVEAFMAAGDRFTKEKGSELENRIKELERRAEGDD